MRQQNKRLGPNNPEESLGRRWVTYRDKSHVRIWGGGQMSVHDDCFVVTIVTSSPKLLPKVAPYWCIKGIHSSLTQALGATGGLVLGLRASLGGEARYACPRAVNRIG